MKICCDVIRDILPLYAENLASPATRELVDSHLCECDDCRRLLSQFLRKPDVPIETSTDAFGYIKKGIQKRRLLAVLLCFFLTAVVCVGAFMFLTRPIYLTAEEAEVKLIEEGDMIYYEFGDKVDCFLIAYEYDESDYLDVSITAYRRIWNVHYGNMNNYRLNSQHAEYRWGVTNGDKLRSINYGNAETGQEDTVLWGKRLDHTISLPRLVLNYYVVIAMMAAALLAFLGFILRKRRIGKTAFVVSLLFVSYIAASYIVMGRSLLIYVTADILLYLGVIAVCTVLLWGAALCGWSLISMNLEERGTSF